MFNDGHFGWSTETGTVSISCIATTIVTEGVTPAPHTPDQVLYPTLWDVVPFLREVAPKIGKGVAGLHSLVDGSSKFIPTMFDWIHVGGVGRPGEEPIDLLSSQKVGDDVCAMRPGVIIHQLETWSMIACIWNNYWSQYLINVSLSSHVPFHDYEIGLPLVRYSTPDHDAPTSTLTCRLNAAILEPLTIPTPHATASIGVIQTKTGFVRKDNVSPLGSSPSSVSSGPLQSRLAVLIGHLGLLRGLPRPKPILVESVADCLDGQSLMTWTSLGPYLDADDWCRSIPLT